MKKFSFLLIISLLLLLPSSIYSQIKAPVITIQNEVLDFDTTQCNTKKCLTNQFIITNDGDSNLVIYNIDSLIAPPFQLETVVTYPITIPPGSSRFYTYCYTPTTPTAIDSLRLYLRSNSRVNQAIGLLYDLSTSMYDAVSTLDTNKRISVAADAGKNIINNMIDEQGITDYTGIFSFGEKPEFKILQDFTTDKVLLNNAIPTTAYGSTRCIYQAVVNVATSMAMRQERRKIIILMTDGIDNCSVSIADAVNAAKNSNVQVFILGFSGADETNLTQLAAQTGGQFFSVTNGTEFYNIIDYIIRSLSMNNYSSYLLKGRIVSPVLEVEPSPLNFGKVQISKTRTLPVTLKNTGTAPMVISTISGFALPFENYPSPLGLPTAPIAPNGEITLNVSFSPTVNGVQNQDIYITYNACSATSVKISLTGDGDNAPLGPILRIEYSNFDTTYCKTTKCNTITFRNIGDADMTVYKIDSLLSGPISYQGSFSVPFPLAVNDSKSFTLCYTPPNAPRVDNTQIGVRADTRLSLSIGMLFDVSGSMDLGIGSTSTRRIDAAKSAGSTFVSGLLNLDDILDEAAIYSFDENFYTNQGFTTDKTALKSAINTLSPLGYTSIYDALMKVETNLATRANKKVIILLTDGEDNGSSYTPTDVVNAANANNIIIYAIGVGEANPAILKSISEGTGGKFFNASSTLDLIQVYRDIATLLSKNVVRIIEVSGEGVSSNIDVNKNSFDFDSVKVGTDKCLSLIVTNTGNAPMLVSGITIQDPTNTQFTIDEPPKSPILPNGVFTLNICYNPTLLRIRTNTFVINTNSCITPDQQIGVRGIGWDSVTIQLIGEYAVKPGSDVAIPVRLLGKIPLEYEVNNFFVKTVYNKTIIFPLTGGMFKTNTLANPFNTINYEVAYTDSLATTVFNASNGSINNPASDTVLTKLHFEVLHGDNIFTAIELTDARFADGNPRVGIIKTQNRVFADSVCYQQKRLIDATKRIGSLILNVSPNPSSEKINILYHTYNESNVKIAVVNLYGQVVKTLDYRYSKVGEHTQTFNLDGLPIGTYFINLSSDLNFDSYKFFISK